MELQKTITSIFMVPTLKIDRSELVVNGFINGYVRDVNNESNFDHCIYLLFKPENTTRFRNFLEDEYERTKAIIKDYDYEGGYVVVVYQLDKKFEKDFNLVRQGKYSKTSKEFQNLFPEKLKVISLSKKKEETSLQYKIFNKSNDVREFWEDQLGVRFKPEQEIWEGFDEEKEILNIEKINEYETN